MEAEVLILYLLTVILFKTFLKARVLILFHSIWKLEFYTLKVSKQIFCVYGKVEFALS